MGKGLHTGGFIGAGINEVLKHQIGNVGLAHALAAARRGLRVVVIDRDAQANGASVRNFGFVTVTGQEAAYQQAFDGVSVHFTAGENDGASSYEARHQQLLDLGIDSTWWMWPGQGHIPNPDFDGTPFFDFWDAHP